MTIQRLQTEQAQPPRPDRPVIEIGASFPSSIIGFDGLLEASAPAFEPTTAAESAQPAPDRRSVRRADLPSLALPPELHRLASAELASATGAKNASQMVVESANRGLADQAGGADVATRRAAQRGGSESASRPQDAVGPKPNPEAAPAPTKPNAPTASQPSPTSEAAPPPRQDAPPQHAAAAAPKPQNASIAAISGSRAVTASTAARSAAPATTPSTGPNAVTAVSGVRSPGRTETQAARPQAPVRTPQQARADFESQIDKGLGAALAQKNGRVTLRLNPEELGFVRIRLSVRNGSVEGVLEASSGSARKLLDASLPTLKSGLEGRGLEVVKLTVGDADPAERGGTNGRETGRENGAGTEAGGTGGHARDGGHTPDPSPRSAERSGPGNGGPAESGTLEQDGGLGGAGDAWHERGPDGVLLRIDAVA